MMKNKIKLHKVGRGLLIALLLAGFCISTYLAAPAEGETPDVGTDSAEDTVVELDGTVALSDNGYIMTHENDHVRLYCATSGAYTGTFAVENKADGKIWYSNPLDASDDSISLNITAMKSLLTVTYYDEDNFAMVTLNSCLDSVDAGGLHLQKLKNGLRFNFTFPAIEVTVPFTVLLNDDGSITTKVDVSAIEEKGKYDLFDIAILPYFCAASNKAEGFMFVPDGSGAVMNLNNGKTGYAIYSQPVYGGDAGEIEKIKNSTFEKIYMPVYGMQKDNSGIFTVITAGAAQSEIHAAVSGVESDYNTIWNTFSIRKVTTYSLDQGWQGSKSFTVYQETPPTVKTLENRYWFLSGDQAELAGMANTYRTYLKEQGLSEKGKAEPTLYVDYLGAVTRKKSVFGFPMNTKIVATSFDEAKQITQSLLDSGMTALSLRYLEWDNRSVSGKIVNQAAAESKLGGKGGLLNLAEFAKEKNIGFYPDVDLVAFENTSYPFQQYFDVTKNMNLEINRYFPYSLNLCNQNTTRTPRFMLSFKKLAQTSEAFLKSYEGLGLSGLSLSTIPGTVTSDYSNQKEIIEPWAGAQKYQEIIQKFDEKNDLMLDEAIFPNAIYASRLTNVPGSSRFDMTDYEVPFYQMVISGMIPYAGGAANLSEDPDVAVLRALKTGSNLHYSLTYHSGSDIVKDTLYDSWIGTDYEKLLPTVKEQYQELTAAYGKLGSQVLVDFEQRDSGLTVSYFEGGGELWANETNYSITDGEVTVSPKSYIVRKAGDIVE